MKISDLKSIEELMDMKFQHRQKSFAKVVSAENKLRAEVAKLDDMAASAARSQHENMRAIGADVIWKAWLGRTKTGLNMELAQVLAQKDTMSQRVRKDYGRLLASRALVEEQSAEQLQRSRNKDLTEILGQHVISRNANLR